MINSEVYVPLKKETPSKRLGEKPAVRVSSILGVVALKGRALIAVFSLNGDVSRMCKTDGKDKRRTSIAGKNYFYPQGSVRGLSYWGPGKLSSGVLY